MTDSEVQRPRVRPAVRLASPQAAADFDPPAAGGRIGAAPPGRRRALDPRPRALTVLVLDVPRWRLAEPLEELRERAGERLRELRLAAGHPLAGQPPTGPAANDARPVDVDRRPRGEQEKR
ncbi:hypothetical protein [Streptomyces alkaliterrae]|uniref:Uncharacterized protein n=1 Tax=Streptomyces alkaliterrae TaxID=2213162 RepID=A0A5P0YU53_9ACTN|nr:hypothetical protein [Streptomyces alkaliterrae]MBB1253277.1 hypothetical protein [Streptomyces alkaliterrae]MBB1258928.1 hypothetical protein [Streptomyces alkaliterrae]MQS03843.1 hypothetical protein [Streptomyces alkaliterrae]